jgi:hypothetical protein
LDALAGMGGFKNCASLGFQPPSAQAKPDETPGTRRQTRQAAMKRKPELHEKTLGCGSAIDSIPRAAHNFALPAFPITPLVEDVHEI